MLESVDMGFLRRLFGGDKDEEKEPQDPQGLYFYVECDRCGAQVRVRADKKYDLNRSSEGYVWHKTVVDSECFQQIPTVVHLDSNYNVVKSEIDGGHYISKEEYEAPPEVSEEPESPQGEQE